VQQKLILRNAACLEAVSPATFQVEAFEERLGLGPAQDKMLVGNLSLTEWQDARLQILPDRVQLGFKETASPDMVRQATEDFLDRTTDLVPQAPIDFNAGLQLTREPEDPDPSESLLDANALAGILGGEDGGRGGMTLVFKDAQSRWWIELSPQPDEDQVWVFDFNRKFPNVPVPGGARDAVLDWFADVEANLIAQFETIASGADQ
jgi:hypothetical protein